MTIQLTATSIKKTIHGIIPLALLFILPQSIKTAFISIAYMMLTMYVYAFVKKEYDDHINIMLIIDMMILTFYVEGV